MWETLQKVEANGGFVSEGKAQLKNRQQILNEKDDSREVNKHCG